MTLHRHTGDSVCCIWPQPNQPIIKARKIGCKLQYGAIPCTAAYICTNHQIIELLLENNIFANCVSGQLRLSNCVCLWIGPLEWCEPWWQVVTVQNLHADGPGLNPGWRYWARLLKSQTCFTLPRCKIGTDKNTGRTGIEWHYGKSVWSDHLKVMTCTR